MKPKKNLLFTFDYELFLGEKSGSVQKCMIEPTEKLISIFDSFNFKHAVFFVDTTYLIRLKEEAKISLMAKEDFDRIIKQLQELIQKEHSIFPHIHPHWLDAEYDKGKNTWKLSNITNYRFHSISESQRETLFNASIALLKEIIDPVNPGYNLDGYRAGGWCIQPLSDFYPAFKKHKIKYDFSVLPGIKNLSTAQYYDFENAPVKRKYNFEEDVTIENKAGSFTEVAISVINISPFYRFLNKLLLKYLWKTGNRSIGDGSGVVATKENPERPTHTNKEMVSLELLTLIKLPLYKNYFKNEEVMHFISHPKMLSQHNFYFFKKFFAFAFSNFEIESDFRQMLG